MHIEALVSRQTVCISCPEPADCSCSANETCVRINRDCNTCSRNTCVPNEPSPSSAGGIGVSTGALAGGVSAAVIFIMFALGLFLWYRRKLRQRKAVETSREGKQDVPAPAETVLNRPDPTEKSAPPSTELNTVRIFSTTSTSTVDLTADSRHASSQAARQSRSQSSANANPFDDNNSIQTTGTEGTNVIPIALVTPDGQSETHSNPSTTLSLPVRPPRTPGLNLNLEPVSVAQETQRKQGSYAPSAISGMSGVSSRNSYMSNASYSSDFLNEAPMIISPTNNAVRQVVGVVKAEVIKTPAALSPGLPSAKPSVTSPLASASFGPGDIIHEVDESASALNPFGDDIGSTSNLSRSSIYTNAGTVIDIGSATRVNVGLSNLNSPSDTSQDSRRQFRTTMGRLVSPGAGITGTLQEQQQRALAHAQAQAQAQGLSRRISGSSALSATSTRADSILESFPFVPPSPISDRPVRPPVASPLAQHSFSATPTSPSSQRLVTVAPVTPQPRRTTSDGDSSGSNDHVDLPAPSNRRTLGLSTGSQLSTASSGLGSFPFQIDHGSVFESVSSPSAPMEVGRRKRASLDTLAITSDLTSYPFPLDKNPPPVPKV